MDFRTVGLHPDFPRLVWVVVEQPAHEAQRLRYDPERGQFVPTPRPSLFHRRRFSGTYGWVGGLGMPPGPHLDVMLITRQPTRPGQVLAGYTCGIFYRADGDHKLVALDPAVRAGLPAAELELLDPPTLAELKGVYPRVGAGEGWFGAEEAVAYLLRRRQTR